MKPKISIVVERQDGPGSELEVVGSNVTTEMLNAADDLIYTITHGERPLITNFYDLCAAAFGTTREDAKKRVIAAAYGKRGEPLS